MAEVKAERGAKQEAIRVAIQANPNATAKEIVAHVQDNAKLKVSEASVAVVRAKLKGKKAVKKAAGRPKAVKAVAAANGSVSVADLRAVQALSVSLGGVDRLNEAVKALQEFRS